MQIRDPDFEFLRQLVYDQSSIYLGEEKREMVCTRLNHRLSRLGLASVEQYCNLLKSNQEPGELDHLIDAVSTHFTTFFRELDHFRFVKEKIVPEFLAAGGSAEHGPFRAWSAGCSTGEEAYSLGIVLALSFQSVNPATWSMTASDISARVLEKASHGIYEETRVQMPNPAWLPHFFQQGRGEWAGHYRVKQALREQIDFIQMNLLQTGPEPEEKYHLIFCRNVMIYFDQATAQTLVGLLSRQLHDGGYLIIGHAENPGRKPRGVEQIKSSIFHKPLR